MNTLVLEVELNQIWFYFFIFLFKQCKWVLNYTCPRRFLLHLPSSHLYRDQWFCALGSSFLFRFHALEQIGSSLEWLDHSEMVLSFRNYKYIPKSYRPNLC